MISLAAATNGVDMSIPMSVPNGLMVTVIGMLIVFFALVALIVVVKLISWAAGVIASRNASKLAASGAPAPAASNMYDLGDAPRDGKMVPAKGSLGEMRLNNVDEKTAAMLMAIVADDLKTPLNELRFLSVRRVDA